ncbi:holin [Candidatus Saccharibacteria bacterium]|nr:holin [Candidatus Saccharibacteria bacterium]
MLPDKIYEVLRWLVAVFLPALGVFFATLAEAWRWNLPTEAILATLSAVELFLGAIFGISKVIYDRKENPEKDL